MSYSDGNTRNWKKFGADNQDDRAWKTFDTDDDQNGTDQNGDDDYGNSDGDHGDMNGGSNNGNHNSNQNSSSNNNENNNSNENSNSNSNQNDNANDLKNFNHFTNDNNNSNTNTTGNNTNTNSSGDNNAVNEANNTNTATAENNNNVNIDVNVVSVSHGGGNNGGGNNGGGGNTDPVARDDDFTRTTLQTFITGNVLEDNGNGADSDADGDTLAVTPGSFTTANGGTAVVMADGSFIYIPPANNTANDSFTYTLLDGNGGTDSGTVNIAVLNTGGNTPPVAVDDNFTKFLGQTVVNGNVLIDNGNGADSDADGDTLMVTPGTIATTNGGSVILLADGSFTYTPPNGNDSPDSFDYTLLDGNGGTDIGTVTIATISIQNIPPVAQDDVFSRDNVVNGDVITGNVLLDNGNGPDTDANGDTLSVVPQNMTTSAGNTFVLLANGDFTYTINAASTQAEQLPYELQDGRGGTDTGIVTVETTIPFPNVPPVAQDDFFQTLINTPITTGNLLADNGNGPDTDANGDTLSISPHVINTANGGIVTVLTNGNFIYVPPVGFVGNDTFAYILSDGNGGQDTAIATVNVNTPGNLAPIGGDFTAQVSPGILPSTDILDLPDSDPDGDIVTYEITGGNADGLFAVDPSEGRITLAPGKVIDFATPQDHSLEVTINDGRGGIAVFNVTIVEENTVNGSPDIADNIDGLGGDDEITGDGGLVTTTSATPVILSNDTIESGPAFEQTGTERVAGDAIQLTSSFNGGTVTAGNDIITNNGGGFDRTVGDFESFSLPTQTTVNMGDDMIIGGADADEIFGDVIDGFLGPNPATIVNFGDDIINGKGGDDDLYGDFEQLSSTGGQFTAGNDIFIFEPGSGNDTIWDFGQDDDKLDISAYGFTDISELTLTQNGADTVITLDLNNSITLRNVVANTLTNNDFILAPIVLPITAAAPFSLSALPQIFAAQDETSEGVNDNSSEESNSEHTENNETTSVDVTTSSVSENNSDGADDGAEQAEEALQDALDQLNDAVGSTGFFDLFEELGIFDLINDAIDGSQGDTGGDTGGQTGGNGDSGSDGTDGTSSAGQSSQGTSTDGTSSEGQSSDGEDGQSSDGQPGGAGQSSDGQDGGNGTDSVGQDASASGQDGGDGQDSSSSSNGQDGQDGTPGTDASANGQDGEDSSSSSNGQDGGDGESGEGQDASSSSDGEDASSSSNGEDGGDGMDGGDGADGGDGTDGGDGMDGTDASDDNSMSQTILNGDEMDNVLIGNDLVNIINGFGGNDTIDGSTSGDILTGGTGNDNFVFTQGSGRDIITDFTKGEDTIDVTDYGFAQFSDIDIFSDGFNSIVTLDGVENQITVLGEANLTLDDFAL